jgi:hypothetical protein
MLDDMKGALETARSIVNEPLWDGTVYQGLMKQDLKQEGEAP